MNSPFDPIATAFFGLVAGAAQGGVEVMLAILCHNPTAGLGNHSKEELLAALELAGVEASYCSTKDDEFPKALNQPADLIISAGGDGTVAKVIKNMPDRGIPVAILPLGTANNIARSFGIAGAPHELAAGWHLDHWQPFGIGLTRGPWGRRHFVEGIGLGSIARTVNKNHNSELTGAEKLVAGRQALRAALAEAEPIEATMIVDGVLLPEEEFLAVEIVNASYTGPGVPLAPAGSLDKGTLGIITIRPDECDAFISWIDAAHRQPMPVAMRRGRKIDFTWNDAPLRLDDDTINVPVGPHSATAEIEDGAVKLLVPRPNAG
jgi:diacylglycerol kinase (ATP)